MQPNAHIGLGWDVSIDCFDFTNYRQQQLIDEYKIEPLLLRQQRGGEEWRLLGGKTAEYFGATRLDVRGELPIDTAGFYIGIVTRGKGLLSGVFGDIPVEAGDSFVCSAAASQHAFHASEQQGLEIVRCLPPE